MKKQKFSNKLRLKKNVISNLGADSIQGGSTLLDCHTLTNRGCTQTICDPTCQGVTCFGVTCGPTCGMTEHTQCECQ